MSGSLLSMEEKFIDNEKPREDTQSFQGFVSLDDRIIQKATRHHSAELGLYYASAVFRFESESTPVQLTLL